LFFLIVVGVAVFDAGAVVVAAATAAARSFGFVLLGDHFEVNRANDHANVLALVKRK
jgi:hypothetical protein